LNFLFNWVGAKGRFLAFATGDQLTDSSVCHVATVDQISNYTRQGEGGQAKCFAKSS
jgi:hypothetical protein